MGGHRDDDGRVPRDVRRRLRRGRSVDRHLARRYQRAGVLTRARQSPPDQFRVETRAWSHRSGVIDGGQGIGEHAVSALQQIGLTIEDTELCE